MALSDWNDCQRFYVLEPVVAAKCCQGKDPRGRVTDHDDIDYEKDPEVVHTHSSDNYFVAWQVELKDLRACAEECKSHVSGLTLYTRFPIAYEIISPSQRCGYYTIAICHL